MFVPFLFLQNSLVFFLGWLCGFSLEEYNIHSLPSTSPFALPNSKRGQKAFNNILPKDGLITSNYSTFHSVANKVQCIHMFQSSI
jgi:hypothetical protein